MDLKVVILAAGKGTRMHSRLPKVLQPLAQRPLLHHVISTARQMNAAEVISVIGHGAQQVRDAFADESGLCWCMQEEQLGTGHAVKQALDWVSDDDCVLILYGDVPLISAATLNNLVEAVDDQHPLSLLTLVLDDAEGYGRIVRDDDGCVLEIVEQKDASEAQKQIREINTGIMAVRGHSLIEWLGRLRNDNAQGEFYLTDIIAMAVADGFLVKTSSPKLELEVLGVNNKIQLQQLERLYQQQCATQLMQRGVTLIDAARIDIRGEVSVGMDVEIDVNVVLSGEVKLADGVKVGANCVLHNVSIGANSAVQPFSHLEDCSIGEQASVGPYARLRPGTQLGDQVRIGNFVETKKAIIGAGSKVNHLSYVGDTIMGESCNIGAGTITCNYDGVNKHQTHIGDRVFVGSDTQLIAPIRIGDDAMIGAGSTLTKDAPAQALTLSRAKQLTLKGWQKPSKDE